MKDKIVIDRLKFMEEYQWSKLQYEKAEEEWKDYKMSPIHIDHLEKLRIKHQSAEWILSLDESEETDIKELTHKDIISWLKKEWSKLYQQAKNNNIPNHEYARRRRYYDDMIWELGGWPIDETPEGL
jgi:hypothetical protein